MNFVNFPESNMPLGAGKGNENTSPMRVMVCEHPDYKSKPTFYAGKFEFSDEEKIYLRHEILKKIMDLESPSDISKVMDVIIESLPPLWITSMHGWSPLILSIAHPFEMGYVKKQLNRPQDN
jgi:hypothetical protein